MGISLNPSTLLNGQGINVSSLVQQVLSEKGGELTVWEQQQATLQNQAVALTSINSDLANLAAAVQTLSDPLGALASLNATSSDASVLTATAQPSAAPGTHSVVVSTLATAGTVYTDEFANASTSILSSGNTTGNFQIQVGGSNGSPYNIAITQGSNDTLNTLASYINQQNIGVTASVITDANGARLALSSQSTGTTGALAISGNNTNLVFNAPTGGTNATLTIDGIPFSSTTNTIAGAIPGVTLNLVQANPSETVGVTVGADVQSATQAINSFVNAYNQVINDINQQFTFNAATNSEGPLGADSALRQLQTSLLSDAAYSTSNSAGYVNLASLGISTNDDGTLTVNSTQLSSALASNPSAVQAFFQNASQNGFATSFNNDLTNLTDPVQGVLNADITENQTQQQNLTTEINNFEIQLQSEQTALLNEYNQVNASLQAYPLQLQQVTETLGTLGSGSTSGSTLPTLTSGL